MASSTFTFYYFSPRVTRPLCNFCFLFESHPLLSPGVEPEKGEWASSTFAPGSSFSLDYCPLLLFLPSSTVMRLFFSIGQSSIQFPTMDENHLIVLLAF